ncbi:hypothetical protein [Enterobacter kobei]|nr:hypothetical protein [Enterobacter kobei]MCM7488387.1 hypothetical protein [Enterobacter kobei]
MDLSVEESGLVLCGLFRRVAASPYPTYKTRRPGKRSATGQKPHDVTAR